MYLSFPLSFHSVIQLNKYVDVLDFRVKRENRPDDFPGAEFNP